MCGPQQGAITGAILYEGWATTLEAAEGLAVTRVPRRELAVRAAVVLRRTPQQLRRVVDSLGRDLGPPWGVDQKDAALIAWLVLGAE